MQRVQAELAPAQKPPAARKTFPWMVIGAVIAFVALCALLYFIFIRTDEVRGTVQSVSWQLTIPIEFFGPVEYQDWEDQIPADGSILYCEDKYHHTQDQPADNSVEVCGTPYNVDTGSGFAEVVQDCEYEVYESFCEYTVDEWYVVDTAVSSGAGFNPQWPVPDLDDNQRLGDSPEEEYVIVFSTEGGSKRFVTSNFDLYKQAGIGTTWTLEVNQIDGVVSIER